MAQIALAGTAAVVGGIIGGPFGAQLGWLAGSVIGSMLFRNNAQHNVGSRMHDLDMQTSTWGKVIPTLYGTQRMSGNVIWQSEIDEHKDTETEGGKGFGSGVKTVTYTYSASFAVAVCKKWATADHAISGIRRVWADNKLIFKRDDLQVTDEDKSNDYGGNATFTTYMGTEEQEPDSVIEAVEGVGNVPAFKGLAYVVFEDFDITPYGRIPIFSFEVVTGATMIPQDDDFTDVGSNPPQSHPPYDPISRRVFLPGGSMGVIAVDVDTIEPTVIAMPFPVDQLVLVPESGGGPYIVAYRIAPAGLSEPVVGIIDCGSLTARIIPAEDAYIRFTPNFFDMWLPFESCHTTEWPHVSLGAPYFWWPGNAVYYPKFITNTGMSTPVRVTCPGMTSQYDYIKEVKPGESLTESTPMLVFFSTNGLAWDLGPLPFSAKTPYGENGYLASGGLPEPGANPTASSGVDWVYDAIYCGNPLTDGSPAGPIAAIGWTYEEITFYDPQPKVGVEFYPVLWVNLARLSTGLPSSSGYKWNLAYDYKRRRLFFGAVFNTPELTYRLHVWWCDLNEDPIRAHLTVTDIQVFTTLVTSVYHHTRDTWYVYASNQLYAFNPETMEITRTYTKNHTVEGLTEIPGNSQWMFGYYPIAGTGGAYRVFLDDYYADDPVGLDEVVKDVCLNTKLVAADIDVTGLNSKFVRGYVISQQASARTIIDDLRQSYFFDGVYSNKKIKFTLRESRGVVCTIPETDLILEEGSLIQYSRKPDGSLPNIIQYTYINKDLKYEQDVKFARRNCANTKDTKMVEAAIVFTNDEAQQIAEKSLGILWSERIEYTFSTGWKYLYLDVGDPVVLETGSSSHEVMLTEMDAGLPGIIKFKAVSREAEVYQNLNTGDGAVYTLPGGGTVTSKLYIMDVSQLSDLYDGFGFYMAASPAKTGLWNGTSVYSSMDGVNYSPFTQISTSVQSGNALNALGDGPSTIWDEGNTVSVKLISGSLASVTELELLNGANAFLIGDEIIQAQNAVLQGDGSYVLSRLLRGRKGTDWATGGHTPGERFLVLTRDTIFPEFTSLSQLGQQVYFKAVSYGLTGETATKMKFTNSGRKSKPYSVRHIRGERDGSNNLTMTWIRRTRIGGEWLDYTDVPLGETSEAYEIDIVANDGVILRTLTSGSQTVSYTAAQQTSDGLTPGGAVTVRVYQLSGYVGRGVISEATI